jgi:hypothetical protein
MSVTIPFPPEIEAKLRQRAAAAGKDVGSFVREAVEEKLALPGRPDESNAAQWLAEFDAWMRGVAARESAYPPGFVADDSRETVYEGRGE